MAAVREALYELREASPKQVARPFACARTASVTPVQENLIMLGYALKTMTDGVQFELHRQRPSSFMGRCLVDGRQEVLLCRLAPRTSMFSVSGTVASVSLASTRPICCLFWIVKRT